MHEELLALAERTATVDISRPRQANLRRAVSTTYYAVFHFLVDEACRAQFGTQHADQAYRHALGRAFAHTVMKESCRRFGAGTLKESVIKGLPRDASGNYAIPNEIQNIAMLFTELQEMRHLADYDRSERFRRLEVLKLIDQARRRMADFRDLSTSNDRKFFLACLWAWKELANR